MHIFVKDQHSRILRSLLRVRYESGERAHEIVTLSLSLSWTNALCDERKLRRLWACLTKPNISHGLSSGESQLWICTTRAREQRTCIFCMSRSHQITGEKHRLISYKLIIFIIRSERASAFKCGRLFEVASVIGACV
jgi:hypothetical protein